MAAKNSTRSKRAGSRKPSSPETRPASGGNSRPDLYAILGRFSDALALLETVEHAFVAAEEGADGPERLGLAAVGAEIATLGRAVKDAKAVYSEFDLALVTMAKASR